MHAQDCTYGGVTVCSFALMCAVFIVIFLYIFFFVFVINHDVTAARMFVPVWGHRTNTMNVDVVSFVLFFCSKGLEFGFYFCFALLCHLVP